MKKEDQVLPETRGAGSKAVANSSDRNINTPRHISAHRNITAPRLLAAGAAGLLLYFAHVAFIPVALALLLALVLSGPVEALRHWRIPRSASAAVLMTIILGLFAALVNFALEPAQEWFAAAPHTLKVIEKKIRPLEQAMSRVDELRNSAGNIGSSCLLYTSPSPRDS